MKFLRIFGDGTGILRILFLSVLRLYISRRFGVLYYYSSK